MQAYYNANISPNYYSVLRVRRHSDPALFRAAYKERSLQLHPDKNPAPDAQEQFNQLKAAYDVRSSCEFLRGMTSEITF